MENDAAYRLAVRWLSLRPLTRAEVAERLARRGLALTPELAARLEERGWLSDQAVVEAEVAAARRKRWGPALLRARLESRGITPEMVAAQLEVWDDKVSRELAVEESRALAKQGRDVAAVARRLSRRGFPTSAIAAALAVLAEEEPELTRDRRRADGRVGRRVGRRENKGGDAGDAS
jgi:SOS response regulatory protein OraA/RecX